MTPKDPAHHFRKCVIDSGLGEGYGIIRKPRTAVAREVREADCAPSSYPNPETTLTPRRLPGQLTGYMGLVMAAISNALAVLDHGPTDSKTYVSTHGTYREALDWFIEFDPLLLRPFSLDWCCAQLEALGESDWCAESIRKVVIARENERARKRTNPRQRAKIIPLRKLILNQPNDEPVKEANQMENPNTTEDKCCGKQPDECVVAARTGYQIATRCRVCKSPMGVESYAVYSTRIEAEQAISAGPSARL